MPYGYEALRPHGARDDYEANALRVFIPHQGATSQNKNPEQCSGGPAEPLLGLPRIDGMPCGMAVQPVDYTGFLRALTLIIPVILYVVSRYNRRRVPYA